MKYTALFGHFSSVSVSVGQTLSQKDRIGVEGNTGISYGAHCHIAVARGSVSSLDGMRLGALNSGSTTPDKGQCEAMATSSLYAGSYSVTTTYLEKEYEQMFGVRHPAIDVSAATKGVYVQWPRTEKGRVTRVYHNDSGYGNAVMVEFETGSSSGGSSSGGSTAKGTYKVVEGDNLTSIASKYGTTVDTLLRLNPQITNPDLINVGQIIQLPTSSSTTTGTYKVVAGDNLTSIAASFSTTVNNLLSLNPQISNPNLIHVGDTIKVPSSGSFKVGDKVKIVGSGNASSVGNAGVAGGVGEVRYITAIYPGRAFPYQVGNKGKTDGNNTTGFYKASALQKA